MELMAPVRLDGDVMTGADFPAAMAAFEPVGIFPVTMLYSRWLHAEKNSMVAVHMRIQTPMGGTRRKKHCTLRDDSS